MNMEVTKILRAKFYFQIKWILGSKDVGKVLLITDNRKVEETSYKILW